MRWLVHRFLLWAHSNDRCYGRRGARVVRFDDSFLFRRYAPFWQDEFVRNGKHYNRPPLWRPFNVLIHWWCPVDDAGEGMHDHPRWSITVCLRGQLIERTPWGERTLRPGSVVLRSRKYIHSFSIPDGYRGKTWTMFIVGRRNYAQNTYVVTSQRGDKAAVAA